MGLGGDIGQASPASLVPQLLSLSQASEVIFDPPSTPSSCRLDSGSGWRLDAVSWRRFSPEFELPDASGRKTLDRWVETQ